MTVYRVTIRRLADHTITQTLNGRDNTPMDYPAARRLLLGVGRLLPVMRQPGGAWYLAAEPVRGE